MKVNFKNIGSHPHSMHFHGWHPPAMDGALAGQEVQPGETFVYEFDADPFGLHLYHCHTVPVAVTVGRLVRIHLINAVRSPALEVPAWARSFNSPGKLRLPSPAPLARNARTRADWVRR